MNLKNIYEDGQMYYKSVWNLYEEAFPKEEQKSVEIMELLKDQGKMEIYAIEDHRIKETVVMAAGVSGFFWKNSKTGNIFLKLKSRMTVPKKKRSRSSSNPLASV